MGPASRFTSLVLALALFCALSGAALAVPGTVDDSQKDFNVPGKETAAVVHADFVFKGFKGFNVAALKAAVDLTKNPGGFAVAQNQNTFPILNYAGVSGGLLVYLKNGQNSWHVHPRASELVTVISGGPLECQIVDTTGKLFKFNLYKGDSGLFPQGLIHLQQNLAGGEGTTLALQAFGSGNPGVSRTIPHIFQGTDSRVSIAFNNKISPAGVATLRNQLVPGFPKKV